MSLTKLQVQSKYPEVYESYTLQASLPEAKYIEKLKFWEASQINCFERWTIPYFLEREKEKKRPCLRLNYPPDGKCNECTRGTCRYDKVCFMCGLEGHGAFQSFPGGKMKGELKCTKHRNFLSQLGMIRLQHGIDEEGLRALFKLPGYNPAAAPAAVANAGKKATAAAPAAATTTAGNAAAGGPAGKTEPASAAAAAVSESAPSPTVKADTKAPVSGSKTESNVPAASPAAPIVIPMSPKQAQGGMAPGLINKPTSPLLSGAAGGANWSLSMDGNNLNSSLNSILSSPNIPGGYDPINAFLSSSTTSTTLEDSGRRLWAGPAGGSNDLINNGAHGLLPGPPALLPMTSPATNSKLPAAQAPNVGLFSALGGGNLGLMAGFEGMNLAPGLSPPQSGFPGSANSAMFPGLNGASLPAHLQFQSVELVDTDDFANHASLRVSLVPHVLQRDESTGSYLAKGALISHRGADDVLVRCWRKSTASIVDSVLLRSEIKALRVLSRKCAHVAKILHMGAVDLSSQPATPTGGGVSDLVGIVTETSDLGTLDRFTINHLQMLAQNPLPVPPPAAGNAPHVPPLMGYSTTDLQSMCVQLIEGLIQCHEMNIRHRDIRPQNILVSPCTDKYQSRQFARGLQLKYANFTPVALLPLCTASENPLLSVELDKWVAPEVDADTRKHGVRFQASSDVWSLGLTIYYLATGGQLPFDSFKQACDAAANPDYRRACLEKHNLQERAPMLYDLIERLVRPAYMRTDLQIIRCHPFLWTMDCRRSMLTAFANASMMRGSDVIANFVTGIDKISPLYVFGADGWVAPMAPFLLNLVQPKVKTDFWWSGTYLLQAIKHQLQFPETLMQSVYPRMSVHQATHAYLRQITEVDFPRLLILLYELGGIHGKWLWDGDEIVHTWN